MLIFLFLFSTLFLFRNQWQCGGRKSHSTVVYSVQHWQGVVSRGITVGSRRETVWNRTAKLVSSEINVYILWFFLSFELKEVLNFPILMQNEIWYFYFDIMEVCIKYIHFYFIQNKDTCIRYRMQPLKKYRR